MYVACLKIITSIFIDAMYVALYIAYHTALWECLAAAAPLRQSTFSEAMGKVTHTPQYIKSKDGEGFGRLQNTTYIHTAHFLFLSM